MLNETPISGIQIDEQNGHLFNKKNTVPIKLAFDLVFVRHGETYGNCGQVTQSGDVDHAMLEQELKNHEQRVWQGNVDESINQLTSTGKNQAQEAAKKIKSHYLHKNWLPDFIFHSPLTRAKETGLPFVKENDLDHLYIPHPKLHEISFGSWENKRICDFSSEDYCHLFYTDQNANVKAKKTDVAEPESFFDVLLRIHQLLLEWNDIYPNKKVMVFSHSMVGAACAILVGKGQNIEGGDYLAFDGKRQDGTSYAIAHATPIFFSKT